MYQHALKAVDKYSYILFVSYDTKTGFIICHPHVRIKTRPFRPHTHTLHQQAFLRSTVVQYSSLLTLYAILQDHLTNGRNSPPVDASQDWTLTYSSQYNGVTTLRCYRKLNTTDEQDVVIQVKTILKKNINKCQLML